MTARQTVLLIVVVALAAVAAAAIVPMHLPEHVAHVLHVLAWAMGASDVVIVAVLLLADGSGH